MNQTNSLLALLTVTLTGLLQDKCEETVILKSLTCFTLLRLVPNEYVGREKSRLCVIRNDFTLIRIEAKLPFRCPGQKLVDIELQGFTVLSYM